MDATATSKAAGPVRVEVISNPLRFAALRREWSELMEQAAAGIFNSWEWLYSWHQRVAPGAEPWVLTARDDAGRLLGVLPLMRELEHVGGRKVRRLSFLGERNVGSDYLDVVAAPGREEEVTAAFVQALRDQSPEWDLLELNDFDERSATPSRLRALFPEQVWEVGTTQRYVCPNETFGEGETFDQFLRRTKRRDNYLRRRKWLEKQEGYRIEITTDPAKLTRPLAEFFRLHKLRWACEGGSSGIGTPKLEAFHRDVTELLAERGKLRLYTMWLGNQAVASVYGIVHRDTFMYYQAGYDPEWRNKSVGMVLVGATFEDAISLGLRHYDFLRGPETYKADWVSKVRNTVATRVYAHRGAGATYVWAQQSARELRGMVKRLLPENATERLRRLRRQLAAA